MGIIKKAKTKSYLITWYQGSVVDIEKILERKFVEDDPDITKVDYTAVLPEDVKKTILLTRKAFIGPKEISVDYGSYTKFVRISEFVEED